MKTREIMLALIILASIVALPSCGVATGTLATTATNPGPPVSLSVSPAQTISVPVNGVANYTATTSSTQPVVWSIGSNALFNPGSLTYPGAVNTAQYTAPPTPPIYPAGVASSFQGTVTLETLAYNSSGTPTLYSQTFAITAPSVTAGITPATATVALGSSTSFSVYAIGSVNNNITLQVNGVTGGSSTVGTISQSGVYLAPAVMPATGATITITCISQADPTRTGSATVTLH
jgi:hypothetical protein